MKPTPDKPIKMPDPNRGSDIPGVEPKDDRAAAYQPWLVQRAVGDTWFDAWIGEARSADEAMERAAEANALVDESEHRVGILPAWESFYPKFKTTTEVTVERA